jgi:RNA polymerase sigma factor (sigma-70 family)
VTERERGRLIDNHLYLARCVASRHYGFVPPGVDRDDLVSIAYIGLCEAARKYNPLTGVCFEYYATRVMTLSVLAALRSWSRGQRLVLTLAVSTPTSENTGQDDACGLYNDAVSSQESTEDAVIAQLSWEEKEHALREALTILTDQQRLILVLRYEQRISFRQIGATLESSESSVRRAHRKCLDLLRDNPLLRECLPK